MDVRDSASALLVAGLVCDQWLPINKKLWTTSFALFMAGLDFVLLAGFAWIVDGLGWRRPVRPFVILGMNAIAIYMISELLDSILWTLHWRAPIYHTVFAPLASPDQRVAALCGELHAADVPDRLGHVQARGVLKV